MTSSPDSDLPLMQWQNYALGRDDAHYGYSFDELIDAAVSPTSRTLIVVGLGFDPRATIILARLLPRLKRKSKILAVVPEHSHSGESREFRLQQDNEARAQKIADDLDTEIEFLRPANQSRDRRFVGLRVVRDLATRPEWHFDHVVIDISSMPTAMFFAFVAAWLRNPTEGLQLQVVATENHWIDDAIIDEGVETPRFLPGFAFHGEVEDLPTSTRVWLPILGANKHSQIAEISAALKPDEVCPVLPFPAHDPRRGDNLVYDYNSILFEENQADPMNFIHADSGNPFDLYQSVVNMSRRYKAALAPLGEPVIVPSSHGSKLLSVGILLASHQEELSVISSGPVARRMMPGADDSWIDEILLRGKATCLWLTGEPYR